MRRRGGRVYHKPAARQADPVTNKADTIQPEKALCGNHQFSDSLVQIPNKSNHGELWRKIKQWTTAPYQPQLVMRGLKDFAVTLQVAMIAPGMSYKDQADLLLLVLSEDASQGSKLPPFELLIRYIGDILRHNRRNEYFIYQGWLPTLTFLTSEVLLTWLDQGVINRLYDTVNQNVEMICETIESFSWPDDPGNGLITYRAFTTFYLILRQYTIRFHTRLRAVDKIRLTLGKLIREVDDRKILQASNPQSSLETSQQDLFSSLSSNEREYLLLNLANNLKDLHRKLAQWDTTVEALSTQPQTPSQSKISRVTATCENDKALHILQQRWVPPGGRHSNDHHSISKIKCFPTIDELLCDTEPCFPANFPLAPHHIVTNGVERQLDTCFRLMREDFVSPIRDVLKAFRKESKSKGSKIFCTNGRVKLNHEGSDIVCGIFQGACVENMEVCPQKESLCLVITATWTKSQKVLEDTGNLRNKNLVGIFDGNQFHLGLLKSDATATVNNKLEVLVKPLHQQTYNWGFAQSRKVSNNHSSKFILFEIPNLVAEVQLQYLEVIRQKHYYEVPFKPYLGVPMLDENQKIDLSVPMYPRNPGFAWNLSCLLGRPLGDRNTPVRLSDPGSKAATVEQIVESGKLDQSQAEALIHCLSSEVALIKGYRKEPFLEKLYESNVTGRFTRIGVGSKSELIQPFNLNCQRNPLSRVAREAVRKQRGLIEEITAEIDDRCNMAFKGKDHVIPVHRLESLRSKACDGILDPPSFIRDALSLFHQEGWTVVNSTSKSTSAQDPRMKDWLECNDFAARVDSRKVIEAQKANQSLIQPSQVGGNSIDPFEIYAFNSSLCDMIQRSSSEIATTFYALE
ncbi:uncharacterized protein MELLADRAFT_63078 [Melampsora larici-populina 98AG31]|uniref:Uncharacterized protein n=1 Tax=Melampsora larici-populina (strain 98AG31 / pathotype 3-4-7) TaxID=747676 RepID=F4RL79_MELLP|nr:uncharacterized protein MELLADRAFT_63078 [Melampsora larici-populina 98AG31]EGG06915.1 hypothetical protein MELLADRAFT_63078 [Melampsora larici-populina 98AG31]